MRRHLHIDVGLRDIGEICPVGSFFDSGEHHFGTGVLVVHAQERTRALLVERKKPDEVVVVTEAPGLVGSRQHTRVEGPESFDERVAPADQDVRLVAIGDVVGLVDAGRQLAEHKSGGNGPRRAGRRGQRGGAEKRGRGGDPQRALEHVAAAVTARDHGADGAVGLRRERDIVESFKGFRLVGETVLLHVTSPRSAATPPS